MYQPTLGRFLSVDPLSNNGPDLMTATGVFGGRLRAMREHPYVYARNTPVRFVDPSGLTITLLGDKTDGLAQLRQLCPEARLSMAGSGNVKAGGMCCCGDAQKIADSMSPTSCECICDLVTDNARIVSVAVVEMTNVRPLPIEIPDGSPAFVDGVNGPCQSGGSRTGPSPGPVTRNNFTLVVSPSSKSKWKFGAFLDDTTGFAFRANFIVLGHELCGHAWKRIGTQGQPKWNRPAHDPTIDIENAIAQEHGDNNVRGKFADAPGVGESAAYLTTQQLWYWPDECLPRGLHYPQNP